MVVLLNLISTVSHFVLSKRTFNFLTAKMHSSLSFKDYYTRQIKERISPK